MGIELNNTKIGSKIWSIEDRTLRGITFLGYNPERHIVFVKNGSKKRITLDQWKDLVENSFTVRKDAVSALKFTLLEQKEATKRLLEEQLEEIKREIDELNR